MAARQQGLRREIARHQQRGKPGAVGSADEQVRSQTPRFIEGQTGGDRGRGRHLAFDPGHQQQAIEQRRPGPFAAGDRGVWQVHCRLGGHARLNSMLFLKTGSTVQPLGIP